MSDTQHVPVRDAAAIISKRAGRYCPIDSVRLAAKRIRALKTDQTTGLGVIPLAIVETMAKNYAQVGYLLRKGQTPEEASAT